MKEVGNLKNYTFLNLINFQGLNLLYHLISFKFLKKIIYNFNSYYFNSINIKDAYKLDKIREKK